MTQASKRPFRFLFALRFRSEEALQRYVRLWEEGSTIIQNESTGARGTRLHRVRDELAVLAIAEWESGEARANAFAILTEKYGPEHAVHTNGDGELFFLTIADEIASVFPPSV